MTELVGPHGLLTYVLAYATFVPALAFIGLIGYVVLKDLPIMDRQGRYMSSFFQNRKREWKVILSLWLVTAALLIGAAVSSKL
ncbi:hypothetical protein LB542_24365 [Mesorhizobium sp. BR1-1-9]|uniref:hypothetical protein n=1 Tax=unclassified Mesorhizobium TaxID=325217 RepID=UPI00112C4DC7|nr:MULTISPECIES: hypothetical protein [unclassified Mesorhizobium]MBZ9809791.1 hypothetical protein [Mesorhizobium sp. ESP-6-2]MBZ9873974.1 hypothetical protein [Mesorhizobium sp. BR1-1-9]MBZ9942716.1 hypothetical protein [Mesorhizobium sp. BR1-1-13]TPM26759.1 hypothetical protein FJ955_20430 [Mesorhizobium sp. B2-2-2]